MHSFKPLDRTKMRFENNLHAQRLMPWPELNAPFESSWCVIAAGTASTPHEHHEYEIFVAIKGEAFIVCEGEKTRFKAGDTVQFPPFTRHCVLNESLEPFEMYSIWWDAEMSSHFAQRHQQKNQVSDHV
ncbi:cupin domain-containing protein [Serratia ficaria]|uniref:Thermophilic glucose-6-phosphate isomerase and related metalloenzymes n=1 Tax=Serratia ficaria TaxID=61651 RepID=A0A240BPS6_SERFI|nr:cupin domain-containing protein [Serratia ficaria]REF45620.1 mannose-6-phosphate isomerase-like protein (cupin superfamily) [Serratia ficaria]CAI0834453.1 Thermophilic glucose-6-phosphate isomerase and related metalloenzymes [Serratia ficaria]CAI0867236.1 Thermophilic glucose-6-phosphate isomerase and related metalloenzymes [Serratia ficaria]CAI0914681.1 Thermophilic glucose-6-phosphate isomerase and related metalloenzymes [Serratia ficaria]CAI0966248.1 Thermophilic glucose-6-phosphate isom